MREGLEGDCLGVIQTLARNVSWVEGGSLVGIAAVPTRIHTDYFSNRRG
jgi:hypothetical protein